MHTREEEVVNAYSHLISAVLSILFCALFLNRTSETVSQLQIFVLGFTSTCAFFSSFLYHGSIRPKLKLRNLVLDRVGIYLMISGTGVSFALSSSENLTKAIYCSIIAVVASFLIIRYCCKREENELQSTVSYLLFGILCITPITGIFNESALVNSDTISTLALSLFCYCGGVVFYTIDSKKWAHTIWHFMVTAGYASCFLAHLIAIDVL